MNDELTKAAQALLDKLDSLPNDPRYMGVWTLFHTHGFKYDGPFYHEELEGLRKALLNHVGRSYCSCKGQDTPKVSESS